MHSNSSILQPFHVVCSPSADRGYSPGPARQFSGPPGFTTDEEENRRAGAFCQSLVQLPTTNELSCRAQQSAMQDVPYATPTSSGFLTPQDSCSDGFIQTPNSVYSETGTSFDRMPSHRPPSYLSTCTQSSTGALHGLSSPSYSLDRASFPPISSLTSMPRFSQLTSTSRKNSVDRANNYVLGHQGGSVLMGSMPRASQDVHEFPPFYDTEALETVLDSQNLVLGLEINANIQKGFFQADGNWTCYRRNYFSISCSFSLQPLAADPPFFLQLPDQVPEHILNFAMCISAVVNAQYGETRELVQHTPKRDKKSERKPGKVTLQPLQDPLLSFNSHHGYLMASGYNSSHPNSSQSSQPPTQHTFERIQFQRATANNGKRRAHQQYFNLVVELYAQIASPFRSGGEHEWVKIARKLSSPVVVRGRSPGHYGDGRRDNTASMGPDVSSGASGDANGMSFFPQGLGQSTRSRLGLISYAPITQRSDSQCGRGDCRQVPALDQSPLSDSPLVSSSSSSTFDLSTLNDMDPIHTLKTSDSDIGTTYHDVAFAVTSAEFQKLYRDPRPVYDYDSLNAFSSAYTSRPEDSARQCLLQSII